VRGCKFEIVVDFDHHDITHLFTQHAAVGTKTKDRQRIWGLNVISNPTIVAKFGEALSTAKIG